MKRYLDGGTLSLNISQPKGDMMKIAIELRSNTPHGLPTKAEIQKNIDALDQVVNGKLTIKNLTLMNDTRSILTAIQRQL